MSRAGGRFDGVAIALAGLRGGSVDLLFDDRAGAVRATAERVAAVLGQAGLTVRHRFPVTSASPGAEEVSELAAKLRAGCPLVAVGGGTVLDLGKVATIAAHSAEVEAWARHGRHRCGIVLLPTRVPARVAPLVCVPTTLGTGAEVSAGACVVSRCRKRLLIGHQLRPEHFVLVPSATRGLSRGVRATAALEAVLRIAGPFVGSPGHPLADTLAPRLVTELARAGDALATTDPTDGQLLRFSRLAASGHGTVVHSGRNPFGSRLWYVANETASVLGVSKMQATAGLLPAFFAMVAGGGTCWGSAERLHTIWRAIRAGVPGVLPDTPSGVDTLLDRWGLPGRLAATTGQIDTVVATTMNAWGDGLPMLAGISAHDIRVLLSSAVRRTDVRTGTAKT
jgi:NADP-dependent alcohol dehydrogenase